MDSREIKLNLGCWNHFLDGWHHLDTADNFNKGITIWSWNQPLPYPDNSVSKILIQHALMFCDKDKYQANLRECYRVLKPKGILLVKEDNNLCFIWRPIGTTKICGTVRSTSNQNELRHMLNGIGFHILDDDALSVLSKYGDIVNRHRKLRQGICYALEVQKS